MASSTVRWCGTVVSTSRTTRAFAPGFVSWNAVMRMWTCEVGSSGSTMASVAGRGTDPSGWMRPR